MSRDEFINKHCNNCDRLYECDINFSEEILLECMKRYNE